MKTVIANLILIPFLPVVAVSLLVEVVKEAWRLGDTIHTAISDWINS